MYKTAGWNNNTICRIVSREMIRGIKTVFGVNTDNSACDMSVCRLFLHQCENKHVFDNYTITEDMIRDRVLAMLTELGDDEHTYVFDAIGNLLLYFCINTVLEDSQDSGIEWTTSLSEEERKEAKEYLTAHMQEKLLKEGDLDKYQINALLRGYVTALIYIISHFSEYNTELGLGSYADLLSEQVIYHNYEFIDLADYGILKVESHFPEGSDPAYQNVTGSARY